MCGVIRCTCAAVQNEAGSSEREAIVIHPGSSYLYVGFASDSAPQAVPHLIAYRQSKSRDPSAAENPSLVLEYKTEITVSWNSYTGSRPVNHLAISITCPQDELKGQREEGLEAVRRALKEYRRSLDVGGRDVNVREYREFNQRQEPVERESSELSLTDLSNNPGFVIGNEVSL